nr:immunoglobulin heavy chain junction region [Macaca mulatta]MOV41694.1 immunoglobulin heavy chain junction region [Macaca mulatta]MOV42096.1 immunoglobulin heavy chain junction region [Macaca mulatta]MOV43190.1 immunoglobulin heavy chain junction region [Macaca mulatta]MOV44678.1 immunoglobulin heavy chain junction region [Macaca mulatta]
CARESIGYYLGRFDVW